MTIRVVLADDHDVMRTSMRDILQYASDINVVGEARNGREALNLVEQLKPDILLLDMEMPGLKGVDVVQRLQEKEATVRVLALSAHDQKEYVLSLLAGGAAGYLLKGEAPHTIIEAVRGVARGERNWMNQQLASQITAWTETENRNAAMLTPPEMAVLKLVIIGQTDDQIAKSLELSQEKVSEYLKNIYTKLNATSRVEVAMRAVQEELI